jgi:hypothetical protein
MNWCCCKPIEEVRVGLQMLSIRFVLFLNNFLIEKKINLNTIDIKLNALFDSLSKICKEKTRKIKIKPLNN